VRVLRDKPICVDAPTAPQDVQVAQADDAAKPVVSEAASEKTGTPRHAYVQLGSFRDPANAERLRTQYADYGAVVMPALVHGQRFHRVVAGPLTTAETTRLKQKMIAATSRGNGVRG